MYFKALTVLFCTLVLVGQTHAAILDERSAQCSPVVCSEGGCCSGYVCLNGVSVYILTFHLLLMHYLMQECALCSEIGITCGPINPCCPGLVCGIEHICVSWSWCVESFKLPVSLIRGHLPCIVNKYPLGDRGLEESSPSLNLNQCTVYALNFCRACQVIQSDSINQSNVTPLHCIVWIDCRQ